MSEPVRVTVASAADAAFLMRDLVGGYDAELVSDEQSWQVLVHPDRETSSLLVDVIDAVQRWIDVSGVPDATVDFAGRSQVMRAASGVRALQ